MNLRKSIVLSMLIVFALLAGCSRSGQGQASGGKAAEKVTLTAEKVTLTVWGDVPNQAILEDCFEAVNAAFAAKYPDIILDYQWSGSYEAIKVALQSDSLPDLFWVQGNKSSAMAEMARAGFLLPLDQFNPDRSLYPPASIEYSLVDGVTYCTYPAFNDYSLVYYNADIFAAHGLKKPATYGEFVSAVETLYNAGVTPFSLGGDFEWSRYWPLQTLCTSLANNDLERIKNGDITGEYPELVYTFEQFREFCEKGYFGNNPGAMDESSAQLAFSNGRVAMIFEGTWNNSLFKDLGFTVGRFAMPDQNGIRAAQSGYSNFNTYSIAKKTKHPEEAFKYVDFLGSLEAVQIFHDYMKSIPVIEGVKVTDPIVAEASDFEIIGNTIYHVLSNVPTKTGRPQDIFISGVIADLMINKINGTEAMRRIVDEMNK
ncbi:MAG: extracellular solute-binding protein [Spirochaetaceae bacterium]|jgi:raffinose/stachyose/melibiose transport system substrate-binding protein|nr:extracellular solute-binding protein [Spirochaetaceae bacterium]